MKKLYIIVLLMLAITSCQKESQDEFDRSIYGTWYYKIDSDPSDGWPIYLALYIDRESNQVTLTTHGVENHHYWADGAGTYETDGETIDFNLFIDVPQPFDWWKKVTRKFVGGSLNSEAYWPVLTVEIESTEDGTTETETFMFSRLDPVELWYKYK